MSLPGFAFSWREKQLLYTGCREYPLGPVPGRGPLIPEQLFILPPFQLFMKMKTSQRPDRIVGNGIGFAPSF
jgi:hypothetical protein